jgi:hypothetical protein
MNTLRLPAFRPATYLTLLAFALVLAGCGGQSMGAVQSIATLAPADPSNLHIVFGQSVFVPAYSEIFFGNEQNTLDLTTTLAIHNTDPDDTIVIHSVRYYNTDGDLVREFIDTPVQLGPLATTGFVIGASENAGGWGANFLVDWGAGTAVYAPVIEAVMVSSRGNEGVSFISPGRVISEQRQEAATDTP